MRSGARVPALLVVALLTSSCGTEGSDDGTTFTVSAAASLADALEEIGDDFARGREGLDITLNVDSSSSLVSQIVGGAPVDVFASADEESMARLSDQGLLAGPVSVIARNELVIVTKAGNPEQVASLADLADVGVVSLCAEEAPCGRYAAMAFADAGVRPPTSRVTRGQNARATLTAVSRGDAVAGVVYRTDALAAGDAVEVVSIAASTVTPTSVIAAVEGVTDRRVADDFIAHVRSEKGQHILEEHGFLPPG